MRLYHITDRLFAKTVILKPNKRTDSSFETGNPDRICFSDTIQGCANALHGFSRYVPKSWFSVYMIEIYNDENYVSNKYIVDNKLVFDADQHGECWITKPVVAYKVAKCKLKKSKQIVIFKPLRELPNTRYIKGTDNSRYNIITICRTKHLDK